MVIESDIFRNKNVLVTGGLGFIGSSLSIELVSLGANVTIIDSLIPEYGGNLYNIEPVKEKVTVNISDVRDSSSINYLVKNKDYLFNLAGTLSHIDSMKDPFTDLEINCTSQLKILEACRMNNKDIKIVFAGTRGAYGKTVSLPVNEEHPVRPCDVNGINNVAGESYHLLYNDVYGIRACSLRLSNTYGPRHQMKHPRQGVLNWFIRQIVDDREIKLYGSGNQVRDANYVDDVVQAFLHVVAIEETNGKVYNLGGEHSSLKEFAEILIEVNGGGKCSLVEFPDKLKSIEIGDYIADYSRFTNVTGWKPEIKLKEGIERTLSYYKANKRYYW